MSAANTDEKRKFGKKIRGKFNYFLERASRLVVFMGQSWVGAVSETVMDDVGRCCFEMQIILLSGSLRRIHEGQTGVIFPEKETTW